MGFPLIKEQAEAASVFRLAGSGRRGFKDGAGREEGGNKGGQRENEAGWVGDSFFS